MAELVWHCLECGDHSSVGPTGDEVTYEDGDFEPCECGGTARVMTIKKAACFEQGIALGLSKDLAWKRAQREVSRG